MCDTHNNAYLVKHISLETWQSVEEEDEENASGGAEARGESASPDEPLPVVAADLELCLVPASWLGVFGGSGLSWDTY
jgi:hypothetical protein